MCGGTYTSWVKRDFIPYVRICSSLRFYRLCYRQLVRALIYLKYPKSVIQRQSVAWCDRDKSNLMWFATWWDGGLQMSRMSHHYAKWN